ncbi:hypothetical protein [uncultured Chitinophaga sp.]|jgi:hypothetical protein|uniref:hypothetical protein n=1 Tax=uncultured Chitinophaga sp. TaxID=339340 RepID=UPI00260D285D|nr:hypothetical protein [uncultured Chitinophaga sp.]
MAEIWIKVIGKVSKELQANFYKPLNSESLKGNELVLFCTYSEYDIPVGHCFTKIKTLDDHKEFNCKIILRNVSQQLFFPLEEIPHGWKTVCKFEFIDGSIPKEVQDLPVLKGWTATPYVIFA